MPKVLKLGTRGSKLAMTQSQQMADAVQVATDVVVELVVITTRGDRIQDKPLPEIGGKGLFTAELEAALLDGSIDFAVHSLKDLPTEDPAGLTLGAIAERVDPRDAMVGCALDDLPNASVVASGSLRRRTQLQASRSDIQLVDIRGNVQTRIKKRDDGLCAATVLAMAGLLRLGIERSDIFPLEVEQMVPAVGQGALGVQCRAGDERVLGLLQSINHEPTRTCVEGERAFLAAFGGGCNVPAGCHIFEGEPGQYQLLAVVADDSGALRRNVQTGTDPVSMGKLAAHILR
jgi:hydroxymethylbilane synthase